MAEDGEGDDLEHEPEHQRAAGLDVAGRKRPVPRASHHLVAVALDPAVDGVGAARGERPTDEHERRRGRATGCRRRRGASPERVVTSSSSITRGLVKRKYARRRPVTRRTRVRAAGSTEVVAAMSDT